MGVYWLLYRPQSAATERLRRLGGKRRRCDARRVNRSSCRMTVRRTELAQRLASPLNKLLPPSATEAKKLQKQLMHAGFRSADAPIIYRAIQLASMAGFPLMVAGVCAVLARPLKSALVCIILAFVVGFFLPRYLPGQDDHRLARENLRWGLADALDLMVVSVEAGLGLNAAMMKVAAELKDVHPDIATEFELANLEITSWTRTRRSIAQSC